MSNRWTEEEYSTLKENAHLPKEELLELLPKRSWNAIRNKARALNLVMQNSHWSKEEFDTLKRLYDEPREILEEALPYRSWKAIRHKIENEKLPRIPDYYRYTDEEDKILKENYRLPKDELVGLLPRRSWESIIQRCEGLGLERPKSWNLWTREEEELLLSSDSYEEALEKLPNRNLDMIKKKSSKMGIYLGDKLWSDAEDDYLLSSYESAESMEEIMSALPDRSLNAIYTRANSFGLDRGNEDKTILDGDIIELYEQGMYVSQIAGELGVAHHTVKKRLERNNIIIEPKILYGEESPNWKGGPENPTILLRGRSEYREWRTKVFERDNYACQRCGDDKGGNLEAHHILNFSSYEDLRFDVANGMTLCSDCHTRGANCFHSVFSTRDNTHEQLQAYIEAYHEDELIEERMINSLKLRRDELQHDIAEEM